MVAGMVLVSLSTNFSMVPLVSGLTGTSPAMTPEGSRLLQKFRLQHQALDLVGAAFDLVFIVGQVDVLDHGAALEHGGRSLQLEILDQRDTVALGEQRAVGIPDLDIHAAISF